MSGGGGNSSERFFGDNTALNSPLLTTSLSGSNVGTTRTLYIAADNTETVYSGWEAGGGLGMSSTITGFSIKEVKMGNHATTVFYGNELIDETNNREFTASTGVDWVAYDPAGESAASISIDSAVANVLQVTTTTDNEIAGTQLAIANIDNAAAEPVVAGATYRTVSYTHLTLPTIYSV